MTIAEALGILKPKGNTEEHLKKAFREFAMKYHPDVNPFGLEMMKLGNLANELLTKTLGVWQVKEESQEQNAQAPESETLSIDEELIEILKKLRGLVGVEREVRGVYIWCFGNTYTYKNNLKEWGFKFAPKKKEWFYAANGRIPKRHHREFTSDEIREKYGCIRIKETINAI